MTRQEITKEIERLEHQLNYYKTSNIWTWNTQFYIPMLEHRIKELKAML